MEGRQEEGGRQGQDIAAAMEGEVVGQADPFSQEALSEALPEAPALQPPILDSLDLAGVAAHIRAGKCRNIIVMAGAGISVSAGIPDFRTPGTGLYDNLAKYNLPEPTAVFDIGFFNENPAPFYQLAKELFPGQYRPTPTHNFIRLLHDHGLLRRCFTQNIDSLEAEAGIPKDKIVAAHGNFDSATCLDTGEKVPISEVREAIMAGEEGWRAMNAKFGGLVKPDIVFFGEQLPRRFYELAGIPVHPGMDCSDSDFASCDLLIVMGTSLVVQPFASLIDQVCVCVCARERLSACASNTWKFTDFARAKPHANCHSSCMASTKSTQSDASTLAQVPQDCPRLLLNREAVAAFNPVLALMGHDRGFRSVPSIICVRVGGVGG